MAKRGIEKPLECAGCRGSCRDYSSYLIEGKTYCWTCAKERGYEEVVKQPLSEKTTHSKASGKPNALQCYFCCKEIRALDEVDFEGRTYCTECATLVQENKRKTGKAFTLPPLEIIYDLALNGMTLQDIAYKYDALLQSIKRSPARMSEFNKGRAEMKRRLRRRQIEVALYSNNPTSMLIWLGKNFLKQKDKEPEKTETNKSENIANLKLPPNMVPQAPTEEGGE